MDRHNDPFYPAIHQGIGNEWKNENILKLVNILLFINLIADSLVTGTVFFSMKCFKQII